MNLPLSVQAGIDDLIPVLIIITVIISRMMKLAKKEQSPPRGPASGPRPLIPTMTDSAAEPGEELRRFLEALTGAPQPEPEPPPAPIPVQQRQRDFKKRRPQPPKPPKKKWDNQPKIERETLPSGSTEPQERAAAPAPSGLKTRSLPHAVTTQQAPASSIRVALDQHLANPQSLRTAWVLREILGPPVGLQASGRTRS